MVSSPPPILVVSGATGTSDELAVRTVLAQFHPSVAVVLVPHVRTRAEMEAVVEQAAANHGVLVHTLVDSGLRNELIDLTRAHAVPAIDLVGPLLQHLSATLREQPAGRPGFYRQQREGYFERVAAIEFSVAHDDGQRHGFAIVDVTDRPVESSADEVIVAITSRLRAD
jgi:hypothetical protein